MKRISPEQENEIAEINNDTDRDGIKPEIDLSTCNGCGGCIEIAPEIFRFNDAFGFLEVMELDYYNLKLVEEAIKNCPKKSITSGEE